ncbi:efflux RND transporter permease subunit [Oligoflexus tunisiensis]|uniref:efflux RND transporter permease subunit n=1 Tax=Oligoflexus tunisiensis TaxID=708132 RepID=UPI000A75B888|nr:efflux RND transporter permease subunit [Oligoflexus tunisiensis]
MKESGNTLTALGVRRPVTIAVMNLLIMLVGLASLLGIDVRELPNVDRPVVSVQARYEGASPKTMDTEVTSILEGAVARVSGVRNIESSSEENSTRIRVEFQPEVDINDASNDVREAVSRVQRDLPEDIDQVFVVKADDDAEAIMQLSVMSTQLSKHELAERIEKDVAPELLSIAGVADVRLNGDQPMVLRVVLDPARMAANLISAADVIETMRNAHFDVPAGSYESEDQELIVRAYASVIEPAKVERMHIRGNIRIGDIGDAFYAPEEAESYSLLNGRMVIGLGIIRQAGSNTIAISDEVEKRMAQMNERFRDFEIVLTSNDAVFIKGALLEVLYSLIISILIVLLVIALFLGQWRVTLVPAVTMPISLIGTLAAIWIFGFSINLLTLLALVLATGLVVDDAIVVMENVQRRMDQGLGSMAAAVIGTHQVFFAVIATTVTLVAVFLPIAFLPGEAGRLFREFALVLAIAVSISSFVAITLCPMIMSRMNTGSGGKDSSFLQRRLSEFGHRLSQYYFQTLEKMLARPFLSLAAALVLGVAGAFGFFQLNQELLPVEDRGELRISLTGPDGASLAYADRQAQKVESILHPYQEAGLIKDIYTIVGSWDKNRALTIATLVDAEDRDFSQMELADDVNQQLSALPGAQVRINQGSGLDIGGGGSGLELALLGNEYEDIAEAAHKLSAALLERVDGIEDVRVQFDTSQPELSFNINREKAQDLKVPLDAISQTLRVMVDEYDVIDLNIEDQAVPVMLGSKMGAVNDPGDLLNIFVPNANQKLVPLSSLISVEERGVAAELDRHAQRRAIELDIDLPPGAAIGHVMAQVRAVAAEVLPANISILFLGEAATLEETSYEVAITFLLAIAVVFLVLAAQFESLATAFIVMFIVPFGIAAAVFALLLTGQSINLYSQIGLVMLIGLMTKNAILLVEFMDQLRDEGRNVPDAVMEGARVRLRPVMMTVLSTVLGSLPLLLSQGPGAEARNAIGWVIFGGLGLSTLFTLYLTPLAYSLIAPHVKPRGQAGKVLETQLESAARQGEGRLETHEALV